MDDRGSPPPLILAPAPKRRLQASSSKLHTAFTMSMTPSNSAPPTHVKTRFLVISDTHSASPGQNVHKENTPFRPPLPKADVLLHCGDLTMVGLVHEYEKTLEMLGTIDADLKLVIAGNHDISLDEEYYERRGSYMHRSNEFDQELPKRAKEMWTGERAQRAGVTYLEEGTHIFTLNNGAKLRVCDPLGSSCSFLH